MQPLKVSERKQGKKEKTGDKMIEMLNVSKKYNNGITAVNNLSVKINQGEFVYIVGPSGAGKSTFIKMMYREVKLTSGTV